MCPFLPCDRVCFQGDDKKWLYQLNHAWNMCASIINLAKQLKMFTKRTNTGNMCAWMLCRCLNRSSPSIFMETVIADRIGESMPPRCGCLARFEIVRSSIALDVTVRTENLLFPYPFYLQKDMVV